MEENGLTAEPGFLIAILFIGIVLASWLSVNLLEAGIKCAWRKIIHKFDAWSQKDPPKNTRCDL